MQPVHHRVAGVVAPGSASRAAVVALSAAAATAEARPHDADAGALRELIAAAILR